MEIIINAISSFFSSVGPFVLLLGLLIFVHELGHYLVAVFFGVRVETFSLGFGKKIFSYKRGETTYCVSIIPLGGYVKMYGDDPTAEIPEEQKKYSFLHKPVLPRIAIVLAGPLMNLFFAIFIFSILGIMGETVPGTQIGDVKEDSSAYSFGFRSGDIVKSVNSEPVNQWTEVKEYIENNAGKELSFVLQREGMDSLETIRATPDLSKNPFIFTTQREVGKIDGINMMSTSTMVGIRDPNSMAAQNGFKTFDIIEEINGIEVNYWRQIDSRLKTLISENKDVVFKVRAHKAKDGENENPSREITIASSELKLDSSPVTQLGLNTSELAIMRVGPNTPAAAAGLQAGDQIVKIDDTEINNWMAVLGRISTFKESDRIIKFTILRDGQPLEFDIKPNLVELPTDQGGVEKRYAIGVESAHFTSGNNLYLFKTTGPFSSIKYGVEQSWNWSKLIGMSFVRLIQNEVSAKNIGGIITIGRVASKSFEVGIDAFLKMMAIISINLFLLNLLPVPVLDGGHLVFFTIEALKGAPISFKKLEIAQQVGLVLLLSLMLFALFNDINNIISSW